MSVKVTVDNTVDAAYIELSDNAVTRTVKLESAIAVDLDAMNVVVGIEVLNIDAELPLQRLKDEFHVHSNVVDLLEQLRPSLRYALGGMQQQPEGTSARVGQTVNA
jgi:uncharacterized protein YuzE